MAGRPVESVLRKGLRLSGGLISRLKRRPEGILVNGEKAYTTRVLAAGDVLSAEVGDPPDTPKAAPADLPLTVLWEDRDLLVLNKPAGITVHADSRRPDEVTLDNALSAYLPEGAFAHPVSRLDRGTTGIITYAKSGYAHEMLRRMLHTPDFLREYRGIAMGAPEPPAGTVTFPIGFAPGSRYQRAAQLPGQSVDRAVPACTESETLSVINGYALLRLIPRTGRTHQLRVHMAAIGHPLAGDWLYGGEPSPAIMRPALHSHSLRLVHPWTGERIVLTAPLPEDMERLLRP